MDHIIKLSNGDIKAAYILWFIAVINIFNIWNISFPIVYLMKTNQIGGKCDGICR